MEGEWAVQSARAVHLDVMASPTSRSFLPAPESRAALNSSGCELGALDLYDAQGCLIARIGLAGDRHSLAIDLAHIVPQLLARSCKAVVLRHSHPSARAEPSDADIEATRAFASLLRLIGMQLHDHIIEGGRARFSFRAEGLI